MTLRSKNQTVIAVDIGSTFTHVALVNAGGRGCFFRSDFPSSKAAGRLPAVIRSAIKRFPAAQHAPAVIAGGRDGAAQRAKAILKKNKLSPITLLEWHERLPLRVRYGDVQSLGADRLANALYAVTAFPKRNVVVICSGTAITVDAVSRSGEFLGGVIMAGIGTQLDGLRSSTRTLPAVALRCGKIPFPGNATEQCMRAGAAYGTAGALNHLIAKYRALLKGNIIVLATGGAWQATAALVDFNYTEVPHMTLIGTALYAGYQ
jgi:pantothenate kinase type III